jgi:hypothetical protein
VKLKELGAYEISLGDTIGVGTPGKVVFPQHSELLFVFVYKETAASLIVLGPTLVCGMNWLAEITRYLTVWFTVHRSM